MIYLSGSKSPATTTEMATGRLGLMLTPNNGYALDGVAVWALDNGCYTNAYPGDDAYMALLDRLEPHRARCLFVTAPDEVGNAEVTLERFTVMAPRIKAAGWPVALVTQDGMTLDRIPWANVDWLFIGGSTAYKLGHITEQVIAHANRLAIPVHVGRVNSWRRYNHFRALGASSCDGTYIAFGPGVNTPTVMRWQTNPTWLMLWGGAP